MDRTVLISHIVLQRFKRNTSSPLPPFFFFPNVYLWMKFSTLALAKAAGETATFRELDSGTCVQTSLLLFRLVGIKSAEQEEAASALLCYYLTVQ